MSEFNCIQFAPLEMRCLNYALGYSDLSAFMMAFGNCSFVLFESIL